MQIEFSPQRSDAHVGYTFSGEAVTVTFGDVTEVYDFTDVPDGEIQDIDQGALSAPVVLRARRIAGELTVVLVLTHDHADYAPIETRFPENPYTVTEAEALLAARDAAIHVPPQPIEPPPFVPRR